MFTKLITLAFALCSALVITPSLSLDVPQLMDMSPDQFGNLILISGEEVVKYSPKGEKLSFYANPNLGTPEMVSAVNALNPIVFYPTANILVQLDNRLNEQVRVEFLNAGLYDVTLLCLADDESVWVYDQAQDVLLKYRLQSGEVENRSLNITQLSNSENKPIELVTQFSHVYLNVPEVGILSFTATGAFERLIPITGIRSFDIEGDLMTYIKDGQLNYFNLRTKVVESEPLPLEFSDSSSVRTAPSKLYLFDQKGLRAYETKRF